VTREDREQARELRYEQRLLHDVLVLALRSDAAPPRSALDRVLSAVPHLRLVRPAEDRLGAAV
jgi:hypothetical protein